MNMKRNTSKLKYNSDFFHALSVSVIIVLLGISSDIYFQTKPIIFIVSICLSLIYFVLMVIKINKNNV